MKSKLLEFEKSIEDEICSRILIFLHKSIDENFPDAPKVASKRFSQTVVASYDKLKTEDDVGVEKDNQDTINSVSSNNENIFKDAGIADKRQDVVSNDEFNLEEVRSNDTGKEGARSDVDPFSSLSSVEDTNFNKDTKAFESRRGFQDFSESEFNSSSSKIFSDRYLNKVARRSKRGIIYKFFRFIFIVLIVITAIVFITGKQDKVVLMFKDFPTFYEKNLSPKIEEFKSYFKSDKKQEDDILDLLNNKK